jgi:hypothetical protein
MHKRGETWDFTLLRGTWSQDRGPQDSLNPNSPVMFYVDYCHTRVSEKLPHNHGEPFLTKYIGLIPLFMRDEIF